MSPRRFEIVDLRFGIAECGTNQQVAGSLQQAEGNRQIGDFRLRIAGYRASVGGSWRVQIGIRHSRTKSPSLTVKSISRVFNS